jgi:hypothetical protein
MPPPEPPDARLLNLKLVTDEEEARWPGRRRPGVAVRRGPRGERDVVAAVQAARGVVDHDADRGMATAAVPAQSKTIAPSLRSGGGPLG